MAGKQKRKDDFLVLCAVYAILIGLALLLHTTGLAKTARPLWSFLLLALGAGIVFSGVLRHPSAVLVSGGLFIFFSGIILLFCLLKGWRFSAAWPLFMVGVGLDSLLTGLWRSRRIRAAFFAPALGFIILGSFFCLFSFDLIKISLGAFIAEWWPALIILSGVILFCLYFISRKQQKHGGSSEHPL